MDDMRNTALTDTQKIASKSRFGLFSQPPPIAIGDNGNFKNKKPRRGDDGKPFTAPRQMLAGKCRSGTLKSSYITAPESIYIKDNFKQEYKRQWESDKKFHTRAGFHELEFKPASGYTTERKSSYKYTEQMEKQRRPIERDETGKVRTKSANVLVNPCTKIETTFLKKPKYMQDEYERQRQLANRQRQNHKKKMPQTAFKPMSHGSRTFYKDSQTYGQEGIGTSFKRSKSATHIKKYPHETDFKLARRGHGDPIGKYPEYIERKTAELIQKKIHKEKEPKQKWKFNNFGLSRPTPSITFNPVNLKIGKYK